MSTLESLGTTDARNRAYVEQHGRTRSVFSPRDSYGMKSIEGVFLAVLVLSDSCASIGLGV